MIPIEVVEPGVVQIQWNPRATGFAGELSQLCNYHLSRYFGKLALPYTLAAQRLHLEARSN